MLGLGASRSLSPGVVAVRSDSDALRALVIAAGVSWSLVFVAVGLRYELQLYGDGSMFAYAIAVRDAWAFHWHNISGRLFVYLFSSLPAETYVALTRDPKGGILVYGLLQFSAPLLGLLATWVADRSPRRSIFTYACGSTACLCPLVFGFPTEMWMAHALFWPALALCHYAGRGIAGTALVFATLLALLFTHGGALIFATTIVLTVALRGWHGFEFRRTAGSLIAALAVWGTTVLAIPPDEYFNRIVTAAALNFINVKNLLCPEFLLLTGTLGSYALLYALLRRRNAAAAHIQAAAIVAVLLAIYWIDLDQSMHAEDRYVIRTVILIVTPLLGALAVWDALESTNDVRVAVPYLPQLRAMFAGVNLARPMIGALALITLVHAVETAKFAEAWTQYKAALSALATGPLSDPALGDPAFVSSTRIPPDLNRLSWYSTTPYLAVLVAPGFKPRRLVVDPYAGYYWLSCLTARTSQRANRALPAESRRLLRVYSCLHR